MWHWVRHGPTRTDGVVGWRDLPADLSDTSHLARLRAYLPETALVVSSDLSRARDTAAAIAGCRRQIGSDPHLREFHFGAWDGLDPDLIRHRNATLSNAYWTDPGHHAPPGGESWRQAAARIGAAVARIEAAYPGKDIIAVAHFGVILTQLQAVLGISPRAVLRHRIDNLSVTTLDRARGVAKTINHRA